MGAAPAISKISISNSKGIRQKHWYLQNQHSLNQFQHPSPTPCQVVFSILCHRLNEDPDGEIEISGKSIFEIRIRCNRSSGFGFQKCFSRHFQFHRRDPTLIPETIGNHIFSSYTRLELLQCLLALWLATAYNASLSDKFLFLLFSRRTLRTMFDWTLWRQRDHWRHRRIDINRLNSEKFKNFNFEPKFTIFEGKSEKW